MPVVVITGASAGIGRATATAFARIGYRVALLARSRDALHAAAREVESLGARALPIPTDVADFDQVRRARDAAIEALGPIDAWINNAMVSVFSPVRQMTPDDYRRVTDVTYLGVVHGTLAALEVMLPRDRGVVIQVGSALSYRAIPLQSAYCAAKHAVKGFTESLRVELLHDSSNVHVTMVHLPATNTPQFSWVKSRLPNKPQPVPPIYQPEVAARAILWAAEHPRRRELHVAWPTIKAVHANKFLAALADRYLARRGFDSQQTAEPDDPARPDNLYHPVPGEHTTHGEFDSRARKRSPFLWLSTHRALATCLSLLVLVILLLALSAPSAPLRELFISRHP